jgi:hypothetical protein
MESESSHERRLRAPVAMTDRGAGVSLSTYREVGIC